MICRMGRYIESAVRLWHAAFGAERNGKTASDGLLAVWAVTLVATRDSRLDFELSE